MSAPPPSTKGVINFKRRTWDKETYERLAIEREDKERGGVANVERAENDDIGAEDDKVESEFGTFKRAAQGAQGPAGSIKAYLDVDLSKTLRLEAKVGKIEKFEAGAHSAGYECKVCDRVFPDSNSLLDHINGREHQSRLGYSMKAAPASAKQVQSRLQKHVETAATAAVEKTKATASSGLNGSLEDRLRVLKQAQDSRETAKKAKLNPKVEATKTKDDPNEQVNYEEDEMNKMLGFSSFG
jgi:U4/U6.U5 tri-snRNP component SNU23